ncbi:MAG: toxin ParE1/3/4 [Paraglaciecola sp.]|jgi:toxin ParE1/3/4
MTDYNVIVLPAAEMDLDDAYDYLESKKKNLGFDLLAEVADILQILEDNPFLYQKVSKHRRRAIVRRFGYNVIYSVIDNEVYIVAIIHGSRDSKRWEDRT